jgi:hypothetical protein
MEHKNEVINIALAKMQKALENYRMKEKATVEALLDQCHAMLELKNACETEQGGSAFSRIVKEDLNMQQATAARMCAVARRDKLMFLKHKLPPAVTTLANIAKLSDDQIDSAVEAGVIHPEATWRQIDAHLDVVRGKPGRADKAVSKDVRVRETIVVESTPDVPPTDWEGLLDLVHFTTDTLEAAVDDPMHPQYMVARRLIDSRESLCREMAVLSKPDRKKALGVVVKVLAHEQEVFEANAKAHLAAYNKALKKELLEEMSKLRQANKAAQRALKTRFDKKDFQFIRGVLHSDRAVDEAKRNKAFDLFQKLAPLFDGGK